MSIPTNLNPIGRRKPDVFQITVNITSPSQQVDLTQQVQNAILKDWGDGTKDTKSTHVYTEIGRYVISLTDISKTPITKFIPWMSPQLVIGCNWKWDSLGDIRHIDTRLRMNIYSNWIGDVCSEVPSTLNNMDNFFAYNCNLPCYISSIPDSVTTLDNCGNANGNAIFVIDKLPPNITTLFRAFRYCNKNSVIDIEKIINNAPLNGFDKLKSVIGFCTNVNVGTNATVAQFMNKCPNVTDVKTGTGYEPPFNECPKMQLFSNNDHFECVVNIPSDNYTWGFVPYSSKGTWYLIQWGDTNISPTSNYKTLECLHKFTSGTKVEHTYAKAGVYTVKLCMYTDSVLFDGIVSHNNQLQFLGNVNGVSFS